MHITIDTHAVLYTMYHDYAMQLTRVYLERGCRSLGFSACDPCDYLDLLNLVLYHPQLCYEQDLLQAIGILRDSFTDDDDETTQLTFHCINTGGTTT